MIYSIQYQQSETLRNLQKFQNNNNCRKRQEQPFAQFDRRVSQSLLNFQLNDFLTLQIIQYRQSMQDKNLDTNILVLAYPDIYFNSNQKKKVLSQCQNMVKKFIDSQLEEKVYSFQEKTKNIKVWNGAGLEVGSEVMRWACKRKDFVFILKEISNKLYNSIDLTNSYKFNDLLSKRKSFDLQKKKTFQSQKSSSSIYDISMIESQRHRISSQTADEDKISQQIRSINKKCTIIYCYFVKEKDLSDVRAQSINSPDFPPSVILKKEMSELEYQAIFDSAITRSSTQFSKVISILKDIQNQRKTTQTQIEKKKKQTFFQWILSSFCPTKNVSQSSLPAQKRLTAKINGFNTQDNKIQSSQDLVQRFKQERGHYL